MTTLAACTAKVEEYKTSYETKNNGNPDLLLEIKNLYTGLSRADKERFKSYIAERAMSPAGKQMLAGGAVGAVVVPVIDSYFSGELSVTRIICGGILGFFCGAAITGVAVMPRPQSEEYVKFVASIQPYRTIENFLKLNLVPTAVSEMNQTLHEEEQKNMDGMRQRKSS